MLHHSAAPAQAVSGNPATLLAAYDRARHACGSLAELVLATAHPSLASMNAYARAELARVHVIRSQLGALLALAGLEAPICERFELTSAGRNARAMTAAPLPDVPAAVDVAAAYDDAMAELERAS